MRAPVKGRGTVWAIEHRFSKDQRHSFDDGWGTLEQLADEDAAALDAAPLGTEVTLERVKTILAGNDSPDIGFDLSINPYRGCEHVIPQKRLCVQFPFFCLAYALCFDETTCLLDFTLPGSPFAKKVPRRVRARGADHPKADDASLTRRREARRTLDLGDVHLAVAKVASNKKNPFKRDFTSLAERHPQHEYLLVQLLAAAKLDDAIKTYTTYQDVYGAIEEFIEFINSDEPHGKTFSCVADIDFQVAKSLTAWYERTYPGRSTNRKHYGKLKALTELLQKKFPTIDKVGRKFKWPNGPANTEQVAEGYPTEVFNQIVESCISDVKYIKGLIEEFPRIVEAENTIESCVYPISTYIKILDDERRDLEQEKGRELDDAEMAAFVLKRISQNRPFTGALPKTGVGVQEFTELYLNQGRSIAEVFKPEDRPRGLVVQKNGQFLGFSSVESFRIGVATIAKLTPNWPLRMPLSEALLKYSFDENYKKGRSPEERAAQRYIEYGLRLGYNGQCIEVGQPAYFAQIFFTHSTIYPFITLVWINTGWNISTILAISDNLDDHIENDPFDPNYVLIYSDKTKSESAQWHRANKTSPLGVYKILKFVQSVITPYSDSIHFIPGHLWQAIPRKNVWALHGRIITQVTSVSANQESRTFLKRHGIVTDPGSETQTIDATRLRTTAETKRREQGLTMEQVVHRMGHADADTTLGYDSDSTARELKNAKIRRHVNDLEGSVRDYDAQLIQSISLQKLREALSGAVTNQKSRRKLILKIVEDTGLDEKDIVSLLAPEGQTYIAACKNRKRPTWPGARDFIRDGESCKFFNKCCLCEQA